MFYLWYLIGFLFVHQNNNNDNSIDGQEYFWSLEKFSISFFFGIELTVNIDIRYSEIFNETREKSERNLSKNDETAQKNYVKHSSKC